MGVAKTLGSQDIRRHAIEQLMAAGDQWKIQTLKSGKLLLIKPDRPSDLVGIIPFPLPPNPQTMEIVLDSISRFPEANPRRTIGVCHWVLKHARPGSQAAKLAEQLINKVDALILAGKVRLGEPEEDERPRS